MMTSAQSIIWQGETPAREPANALGSKIQDLRIEVVEAAADFAALRNDWNELLADSRSNCLFLTWEWLYTWWVHLGHGRSLYIVTVRSGSKLVAIAPLTLRRAWVGPIAIPLLEFAGTGSICSDYLDFIVRSNCETAAATLVSFFDQKGFSLRLPGVKEDSWVATLLRQGLVGRGWEYRRVLLEVCPFIDLSSASWDSYLSSIGSSHRYNFRRRLRNLQKDATICLEYVDSEQARDEGFSHLVNLHELRWKNRGGSSAFSNSTLAFHDGLSRLACERGWLRLAVLKLDGKPAAALYGFRYEDTFHFFQSGFDPGVERYSVGLVTLGLTIRDAIEEGVAEYDLLRGSEAYKFFWTTQVRPLFRFDFYPPRTLGLLHRTTELAAARTRKLVKRLLRVSVAPAAAIMPD